jgi:hypothetical protein
MGGKDKLPTGLHLTFQELITFQELKTALDPPKQFPNPWRLDAPGNPAG